MSVFRVALNNVKQGLLDLNPSTASAGAVTGQGLGNQMNPSIQRGVYVMGPNLINRLLIDGQTFTDCNYWKRFAAPQVPYEEAIVEVVTDDGSIYSDVATENTFPRVFDVDAAAGSTFADNQADIAGDTGGFAVFAQITNNGSEAVRIRLNGLTTAVFDLPASSSQIFDKGDLSISLIEIDHSASGAATTVPVQIITSVRSACNS
jgi:hypothetical protein